MNNQILITGATGFIGSYLMDFFEGKYNVIGTVRTKDKITDERHFVCDWSKEVTIDIDVDVLIHTAALNPSPDKSFKDYFDQNVVMAENVIEFAKKHHVKKIIYMAAVSSFGKVDKILTEESPHNSPDDYGLSKYVAEKLIETSGISYYILILPGVVGPGCRSTWLVNTARRIHQNEEVCCYNAEGLFNNIVHVRDVAAFIDLLLGKDERISNKFLLATTDKVPVREILMYIKERLHSHSEIMEISSDKGAFVVDCSHAVSAGYSSMALKKILVEVCKEIQEQKVNK